MHLIINLQTLVIPPGSSLGSHARCSDQPIIFQKKKMETSQQNSQKPQTTSNNLQQFPTRKPPIKTRWFVFDANWTQESQHLENASHDMLQVTASSPLEVRNR